MIINSLNNITRESILTRWDAPTLGEQEIHYWQIPLDDFLPHSLDIEILLSEKERSQFSNVFFLKEYKYRVLTQGILRLILSKYENRSPREINFHYNKYGKPYLANQGKQDIQFNLSKSNGIAVFAITAGRKVGIDIEVVRSNIEYEDIIERFFSENEKTLLRSIPLLHRLEEFFICWTCKEAFLKATGTGLSFPTSRIDVYNKGEPGVYEEIRYSKKNIFNKEWSFLTFSPISEFIVTIAKNASAANLRYFVLR